MQIGLIGSGNMATALARGWGEPVLCTDAVPGKAEALAAEVGGEALTDNGTLAERADLVVLAHKPAQVKDVAGQIGGKASAIASILGGVHLAALEEAYPQKPVIRLMPNVAAELRQGVTCYCPGSNASSDLVERVTGLFSRVGVVIPIEEHLIDAATGVMSVAPAYAALVVEAQVEAAISHGIPADMASQLAVEALAGSAELIRARNGDTLAVKRVVTSPGGVTAQGLAALERGGVRAAFASALDAVVAHARR